MEKQKFNYNENNIEEGKSWKTNITQLQGYCRAIVMVTSAIKKEY
jgi:hypothetical protein